MSASNLVDPLTNKIYDQYIPQGGGVSLTKGQLITANGANVEVPFPTVAPADGSVLSWDSTEAFGLKYIAIPGVTPLDYQELLSANPGNQSTVVPAPTSNNYVLTSDNSLGPASAGMAWKALGGSGVITAKLPLVDSEPVAGTNQLAINFSATVGEIPYGNGTALEGALTNAPTAGQILGVSAGVPTWIPAGGSGTVTANLPLVEGAGAGNSSLVSIGFSTAEGEIPYGTGTASIGALLAPPTDPVAIGKVLTYAGTPSILEWRTPATPVGGDVITLHSNLASTTVPKPTDKDEQLILVAQEIGASWNLTPSTLPSPFDKAYQPELRFANSAGQQFIAIEQLGGGTPARREIALYTLGLTPNYLITTFVFQSATQPNNDNNAFIACTCNGVDPYGVNHFAGTQYENTVIIGGRFNSISFSGTNEYILNIALLKNNGGVWQIAYVGGTPFGQQGGDGWQGITNNDDTDDPDVGVFAITPFPANSLTGLASGGGGAVGLLSAGFFVGGKFTTVNGEGAGFVTQLGYFNLVPFFCDTASPLAPAETVNNGFVIGATQIQPKADGAVCGILFDATYQYMWLTGNAFEQVKDNGSSQYQLVPNQCQGFVLFYPVGLTAGDSAWGQLGNIAPAFGTAFQYDIKPSTTLPNHIVCMGNQMFVKDISVPTAGNASYTAIGDIASVPVAVGFPLGVLGYFNSIARNITVTTPSGVVTGDFFVYTASTSGGPQYVGYMTNASGTTVLPLDPIPCGPNSVAIGTPPVRPSYGINNLILGTTLTIGGDVGEYEYDADIHANIDFTCDAGVNFKVPAGTPSIVTARFSQPYQSQSYIATSDLAYWVQIGGTGANLTYL